MIIKKYSVFARVLVCLFVWQTVTTSVLADDSNTVNKGSWYFGAGLGLTELDPDTNNTGYSVTDERDTGFKLFAGYDYSER